MNARRAELGVTGRAEISPQWERMIATCLAKEPTQRPPSGAEVVRLLDLSMHALVPFIPREEIKVESLRLDLAPVVRPSRASVEPEAQTAEAVDLPAEVEPVRVWRKAKVLPPERLTFFQSFMIAVRDEALLWFRRVVYLLTIIGVFFGVFYLVQGWNRISEQSDQVVIQMPTQGIPVPAPGQTVRVEVRYSQPPGPPPGWAQPMPPPPPPPGFPGPGPGGPGGPPPPPGPR
jgi:hypothetical protein